MGDLLISLWKLAAGETLAGQLVTLGVAGGVLLLWLRWRWVREVRNQSDDRRMLDHARGRHG